MKVAVFDSGIGGLNLLKECARTLPEVSFYYLADNYNVPYGNKSKGEIFSLVVQKLSLLPCAELSAAVIACNTATSNCIEDIRAVCPYPVIGIQPAVKQAAERGGKCLVLATCATVKSASFCALLERCAEIGGTRFTVCPCEGLAEYIEERAPDLSCLPAGMLPDMQADSVVLGCTHYIFAKELIKSVYHCEIFDGIAGTAARLREKLGIDDHLKDKVGISDHKTVYRQEISFIGGDFAKNAAIFSKIYDGAGIIKADGNP